MNWRCFFGHKFSLIQRHAVCIYETGDSKRPFRQETSFLLQCSKCGLLSVHTKCGFFPESNDDDEGDDDKPPILSPDDFYESIGKQ